MKGFIEIKEDAYEDTIEHLHRLKTIACKMIKKLEEHSEIYDEDDFRDDLISETRGRKASGGRYRY